MGTSLKHLLPRQRKFCDGIAAGLSGAAAARQAGYSEAKAKGTASRLRSLPQIQAGIERRLNGYVSNPNFDTPMEFLFWAMNDPEGGDRLRIQAAIALLPYTHERRTKP